MEERLSTGEVNRFFADAEQHNGVPRYLTRDHLGSIREVTDSAGAVATRNDFDPYGRLTRVAGTQDSRFGYTGHMNHTESGLALALFRAYDPMLGRWLSDDPAGMPDGPNRVSYVLNRPISAYDADGRAAIVIVIPLIIEAIEFAAAYTVVVLTGAAAGQAISDAFLSKSQKEAKDEATREDKFEQDFNKKIDRANREKFPKEKRPEDTAEDLAKTRDGFRKGGRDQVDSSRKSDDRIRHRPDDPGRRCP